MLATQGTLSVPFQRSVSIEIRVRMLKLSWRTHHDGSPGAERKLQFPPGAHTASAHSERMRSGSLFR